LVVDEFVGTGTLTVDFADGTLRACIGCMGDLVTQRACQLAPRPGTERRAGERSVRLDIDGDTRLLFAPEERARPNRADGQRRLKQFWSLWAMKDALVKASSRSPARDTASFTIPPATVLGANCTVVWFPDPPSTQCQLERHDGTRLSAALTHEVPTVPDSESRKREEPGASGTGS